MLAAARRNSPPTNYPGGRHPYENIVEPKIELPPRQTEDGYVRPPIFNQHFVPDEY